MQTVDLNTLIEHLLNEQKNGGKTVKYEGTLLIIETGNSIVLTTEKQI